MRRGGKRVTFATLADGSFAHLSDEIGASSRMDEIGMVLKIEIGGRKIEWNFSAYPRPSLARDVMTVVHGQILAGKGARRFATLLGFRLAIGSILTHIETYDPSGRVLHIRDMDRAFLEALDGPRLTNAWYGRLGCLVRLLRTARDLSLLETSPDLSTEHDGDRLKIVSRFPKPKTSPADSYSPFIVRQIQEAARRDIADITARVRAGIKELEALNADIAANGDHRVLSHNDRILLHLTTHARITQADYNELIQQSGAPAPGWGGFIDIDTLPRSTIHALAKGLAESVNMVELAARHGWSHSRIAGFVYYSGQFRELIGQYERELVERIILETGHRRAEDQAISLAAIPPGRPAAADRSGFLLNQLSRRVHVLESWLANGIPRAKFGTVNFTLKSISVWQDHDYGISHHSRFKTLASIERLSASLAHRLHDALRALVERYERDFYKGYAGKVIAKITALENMIFARDVSGLPENFAFNLRGLKEWHDEASGIFRLNQVDTTTTDKRYGPYISWALEILRALSIISRTGSDHLGGVSQQAGEVRPTGKPIFKRPSTLGSEICPTNNDLTPFMALLALMCQIDYGSLKTLRRDCLQSPANGYVSIVYRKARDRDRQHIQRERDGSLETPGGLIRLILELTTPAHRALKRIGHPDADYLWLAFVQPNQFKLCRFWHPTHHPWWIFCELHEIVDDMGQRLDTIHAGRFRKTVKAVKYMKAGGDVFAIADDHSYAVARDHYANLPALTELHDEAVSRGLRRALDDIGTRVISDDVDVDVQARRLHDATGASEEVCRAVLNGEEDSWLAACLAFDSSPFGAPGEPCPTPFSECLHCANSVFTTAKLPNLLRYAQFLRDRRIVVGEETWSYLCAPDLARIEEQILPRFTDAQRQHAAMLVANDTDDAPLYIPPIVRAGI